MNGDKSKYDVHGRDTMYKAGCRCHPCTEAHRLYERNMSRERRRERLGIEPRPVRFVDATHARIHIKFLCSKKISLRLISKRSGVAVSELLKIKNGQARRVLYSTHKRIMAVPAINPDPYRPVPSDEAKQIISELIDVGLKKTEIATMMGVKPGGHLSIKETIRFGRLQKLRAIRDSFPELRNK